MPAHYYEIRIYISEVSTQRDRCKYGKDAQSFDPRGKLINEAQYKQRECSFCGYGTISLKRLLISMRVINVGLVS